MSELEQLKKKISELTTENNRLKDTVSRLRDFLSDPNECGICHKVFLSHEAVLRHQRRSKICNKINKLPKITNSLDLAKYGIVLTKK